MITTSNTSSRTCPQRAVGALSYAEVPCVRPIRECLKSAVNRCQSHAKALSTRNSTDLTALVNSPRVPTEDTSSKRLTVIIVASLCLATFCIYILRMDPSSSLLLPTLLNALSPMTCTEEVDCSQTYLNWKAFSADQEILVSCLSPLPPGMELIQSQFDIIKAISDLQNTGPTAKYGKAVFVASTGSNTIFILNNDPSKTFKNTLDAGTIVAQMIITDDELFVTGPGMPLRAFSLINDEFNPQAISNTTSTLNGLGIATSGGRQFGCITDNQLLWINGNNFNITRSIPLTCTHIEASTDSYFVSTATELRRYSSDPASSSSSSLSIPNILTITYKDNHLLVGTTNAAHVVECLPNGSMNIVRTIPMANGVFSMLPVDNLCYYSGVANGFGIFNITNISDPQFLASNLLPQIGPIATFLNLENFLGIHTATGFYYATPQDSFTIRGIPVGGSQNTYPLILRAKTLGGAVVGTETTTLTVRPAITPGTPLPKVTAVVNEPLSAMIPTTSFNHVKPGTAMTSTMTCPSGTRGISLNPVTSQYSGTPQLADKGTSTCTIRSQDTAGASATATGVLEVVERQPISQVLTQQATVGVPFVLDLNAIAQRPLNIAVSGLPTPPFNIAKGVISGTATSTDIGNYPITVAITESGIPTPKILTFQLNVAKSENPRFPHAIAPFDAPTTYDSSVTLRDDDLAVNPTNQNVEIQYSAALENGSPLPDWIKFDGRKFLIHPPFYANDFASTPWRILITAKQVLADKSEVIGSTSFTINATGLSTLGVVSITITLFGLVVGAYRKRKVFYNKVVIKYPCMLKVINKVIGVCGRDPFRFIHNPDEIFWDGHSLEYTFLTDAKNIDWFKCFYDGKPCPPGGDLPSYMKVEPAGPGKVKVIAQHIPSSVEAKSIRIVAKSKADLYLEDVTFNRHLEDDKKPETKLYRRPLRTEADKIEGVRFFSVGPTNDLTFLPAPPNGLKYDRASNCILADSVPKTPIIARIRGNNKILETIYMNVAPVDPFKEKEEDLNSPLLGDGASKPVTSEAKSKEGASAPTQVSIELASIAASVTPA